MAVKGTNAFDGFGRPLYFTTKTNLVFDDTGKSLDALLRKITAQTDKESFVYSAAGFPEVGDPKCLYCDGGDLYYWDSAQSAYEKIVSETTSDALEKSHTHQNKSIIDAVTKAYTTEESEKLARASESAKSAIQEISIGSETYSGVTAILPVYPTRESLQIDQVDNTPDLDKPLSNLAAQEFSNVREELQRESARAAEAERLCAENVETESQRAALAEGEIRSSLEASKSHWDDKYTKAEIDQRIYANSPIPLTADDDIDAVVTAGLYDITATINGILCRWLLFVALTRLNEETALARQTAYPISGDSPTAPITRYQYLLDTDLAWSPWY